MTEAKEVKELKEEMEERNKTGFDAQILSGLRDPMSVALPTN